VQKTPKHSVRLRAHRHRRARSALSVNEAACRLMEVALPMLAEQLSRFAVEQRINNGYTGRRAGTARLKEQRGFRSSLLHNSLISDKPRSLAARSGSRINPARIRADHRSRGRRDALFCDRLRRNRAIVRVNGQRFVPGSAIIFYLEFTLPQESPLSGRGGGGPRDNHDVSSLPPRKSAGSTDSPASPPVVSFRADNFPADPRRSAFTAPGGLLLYDYPRLANFEETSRARFTAE